MKGSRYIYAVTIILLLSFSLIFAGATETNKTLNEEDSKEKKQAEEVKEKQNKTKEENKKETKNESEKAIYIDIEEIIEETNKTKEKDRENKTNTNKTKEENKTIYIDLEKIITHKQNETNNKTEETSTENKTNTNKTKEENKKEEKLVKKSLIKDGRIEIEFEDKEESNIEIRKKEVVETKTEKRVQISSKEHFERPLRVYSNLPSEAKKEEIHIYWENEDEHVQKGIEYYDKDENGLTERVSWIVPHLSTQNYKILIIPKNGGNSSNLSIEAISPGTGIVSNPVSFVFEIDYFNKSALDCTLSVAGSNYSFNGIEAVNYSKSFQEGNHSWQALCEDKSNNKSNSTSGSFEVKDLLSITTRNSTMIGHSLTGTIQSNGGTTELWLKRPGKKDLFLENMTGTYPKQFTIAKEKFLDPGTHTLVARSHYYDGPVNITHDFSVSRAQVSFNSKAIRDSEVEFTIDIDSSKSGTYTLYVGNSWLEKDKTFGGNHDSKPKKKMASTGDYKITLEVSIENKKYEFDFGNLKIENGEDKEDPEVILTYPDWEDIIRKKEITFSYKAQDDSKLHNCSLELFNATKSSSNVYTKGSLIFPLRSADKTLALEKNPKNDTEIQVKLVDFDEGHYIWDVECYDNSSNEGSDFNYFQVLLNEDTSNKKNSTKGQNYSRSSEVEYLIDNINDFLEKESTFGVNEKEVLETMGISKDMAFYKKQLVQIDQDFKFNLRFVAQDRKESREKEMNEEIDNIREKIIVDIKVGKDHEFSKNSLDTSLEEIISDYLENKDTDMRSSALQALVDANEELQNNLKTRVTSKKVTIEYLDETKEIVLVQKKFELDESSIQTLFEVLPEEIRKNVIFLVGGKEIGNGIYEFDLGDLDEKEIVYYFEEDFDLKKIEKTESVLFSESVKRQSTSITGMFSGIGETLNLYSFFFIFLIASVGYVGFFIFGKVRLENWKKDMHVSMVIDLISQTKQLVRANDIENARANYLKMQEIYKLLPNHCKGFFYKEIKKVLLAINKKDVMNLVKEYELARSQFRKEDAVALHKRISEVYKKLPKKYQDKVYQRIVKKEV